MPLAKTALAQSVGAQGVLDTSHKRTSEARTSLRAVDEGLEW